MKALEKDRNRRYETANGLAADLRRYLDDEPVQACPPSADLPDTEAHQRDKVAISTVLLVAMVLVVGMVVSTWQAIRARRSPTAGGESIGSREEARLRGPGRGRTSGRRETARTGRATPGRVRGVPALAGKHAGRHVHRTGPHRIGDSAISRQHAPGDEKAVGWTNKNGAKDEELSRFRAEAAALLEVTVALTLEVRGHARFSSQRHALHPANGGPKSPTAKQKSDSSAARTVF